MSMVVFLGLALLTRIAQYVDTAVVRQISIARGN